MEIKGKKAEVLIPEREIREKVKQLASRITEDYAGKDLLVVGILKGSFIFLADLVREMGRDVQVDFMQVASYHSGTESSGKVEFLKDIGTDIKGRNVLLVDDIIDTGRTLKAVVEVLYGRKPSSVKTCVLLDKKERREVDYDADYVGFVIPDRFVVGYGLDWGEEGRTYRDIYAVLT
ncbi:MAG: hypoxanthine phosphoribosyltransferase [Aquificae bacterium]|nr:hypoxanthine phosphoribosyltransferase [Aquificota bacterium]